MLHKPWYTEIFRSHSDGWSSAGSWNATLQRVFTVIEWWNPSWVNLRQFRIDMIRNEIPQYTLAWVFQTNYYRKDLQVGQEDIENEDYLSGMMDNYYNYIHGELSDLQKTIEKEFMPFFSQEHWIHNFIQDLIMDIDRIVIHIAHQIHPYQWKFLKQILEAFFTDMKVFVKSLDETLTVPEVVVELNKWVYEHDNGWVIWEWLRLLENEIDSNRSQKRDILYWKKRVLLLLWWLKK